MNEENKVVYLTDYIETQEKIQTIPAKSVFLSSHEPEAHLAKRGVALVIDIITVGIIKTGIHGAYAVFVDKFLSPVSYSKKLSLVEGNMFLHVAIFVALYFAYYLYTSFILDGKTLGKMTMGLRVIDQSFLLNRKQQKYTLSLPNSLRRALGYVFCYLSFGTFFIFNFSSEDKRGLPDYLSNSRTVSDEWLNQMLEQKSQNPDVIMIDIETLAS